MKNEILDTGDMFPKSTFSKVGGGTFSLPDDLGDDWGVFLAYRGHWWPYCRQQLSAFAKATKLKEEGVKIFALSVDTEEDARKTVEECELDYPLGYGVSYEEFSNLTGCFYEEKRKIIHGTGYVIKPDGTIAVGVYSSGPIGRLVWQDVLYMIQFWKKQAQK